MTLVCEHCHGTFREYQRGYGYRKCRCQRVTKEYQSGRAMMALNTCLDRYRKGETSFTNLELAMRQAALTATVEQLAHRTGCTRDQIRGILRGQQPIEGLL